MKSANHSCAVFLAAILLCLPLLGCGGFSTNSPSWDGGKNSPSAKTDGDTGRDTDSRKPEKGSRDNTPTVFTPSAGGVTEYSCDTAVVDASNTSEGYVMVSYTGSNPNVKLQITGPDKVTQTYNLHGGCEVFPLTAGDGVYGIGIYESVGANGNKYIAALSTDITVSIENKFGPYLYPNQYVSFDASSLTVAKAAELAYSASEDLDVVTSVYNYIIDHFSYDYDKAAAVSSGYLPNVDEIYQSNTGICFDYAAVMAAMLRSQGIPTRLEVGYKGEEYHAWVSIYAESIGWVNGIIQFDGATWCLMDPTFASTSKSPKKFIADDDGYLTKYVY